MSTIQENQNNEEKVSQNNIKKLINEVKDTGRNLMKKMAGQMITILMTTTIGKVIIASILGIIILGVLNIFVQWLSELAQGANTASTIYSALEVENLSELVEIKGDDTNGYHLEFVGDIDKKLDEVIEAMQDDPDTKKITNKSFLKKMIKAEVVSQFPNLGGTVDGENENQFQGTVNIRRVTPNKEIGQLKNTGTGSALKSNISVQASGDGLGTKQDIPEDVKNQMKGHSMPSGATTTYDELSYLTIPYYDFDGNVQQGEMIVRKELADEVLLIFQELYQAEYPIYKMQLIDNYQGTGEDLDWNSIEDNNTSAFCFRNSTGGSTVSKHGLGQAIDINPLINPYVTKEGNNSSHYVSNDCGYIYRDLSKWKDNTTKWSLETAKKANIDTNTKICEIFKKYGWIWGGDWNSPKDYQHFEKTDLSNIVTINNIPTNNEDDGDDGDDGNAGENGQIAGDGKQYVVAIDAGHGPSDFQDYSREYYTTGTSDSSGLNTGMIEWEYNRLVADAIEDKLSIYSNIEVVRIGNSDANPIVKNKDRVNMGIDAGADLYITIHYNGANNKSISGTEIYYPKEQGYGDDTWSMQLAEILAETVSKSIGIENRGIFDEYHTGEDGLVIIKHSEITGFPCVCVEGGYMSSPNDVKLLKGDEGVDRYATGVAAGILEYLRIRK